MSHIKSGLRTLQRVWKMTLYWDPQIGVLWVATAVGQQQLGLHNTATTRERPGVVRMSSDGPGTAEGDQGDSSPASVGAGTPGAAHMGLTWCNHTLTLNFKAQTSSTSTIIDVETYKVLIFKFLLGNVCQSKGRKCLINGFEMQGV